jgi:hypothetical protein
MIYQELMATSRLCNRCAIGLIAAANRRIKIPAFHPIETMLSLWNNGKTGQRRQFGIPQSQICFSRITGGIRRFDEFLPSSGWAVVLLGLISLIGIVDYVITKRQPLWIVVGILFITIYPSMFIVWHGERWN